MKLNKPFTDTFLQSLKPKAKEYTKHDGKESGLMIRVKPMTNEERLAQLKGQDKSQGKLF